MKNKNYLWPQMSKKSTTKSKKIRLWAEKNNNYISKKQIIYAANYQFKPIYF